MPRNRRERRVGYKALGTSGRGGGDAHRVLAERALGRKLPRSVPVHHVDGDKRSAAPRLVICQDAAYHKLLHFRAEVLRAGGNPNTDKICGACKRVLPLTAFNRWSQEMSTGRQKNCRSCQAEAARAYGHPSRRKVAS